MEVLLSFTCELALMASVEDESHRSRYQTTCLRGYFENEDIPDDNEHCSRRREVYDQQRGLSDHIMG